MSSLIGTSSPRVLLIGWDAADWQMIHPLLDSGLMPSLQRLIEGGVMGNLSTLSPMLSPILWTSIATGKRAYAHGVRGFIEPLPDGSGVRPVGTRTRRAKALWNIASQSDRTSLVCAWQASHPAEPIRGAMVSNLFFIPPPNATPDSWPVPEGSVEPHESSDELAELRVHPLEIEAPPLQQLIPRAGELDQNDPLVRNRLHFLRQRLAEVISIHAVATELLEKKHWDFGAIYYEGIDQVGHEFMQFHPPRLPDIPERDFEFYREVMTGIYRFHDLMLGRLVELADRLLTSWSFPTTGSKVARVGRADMWIRRAGIGHRGFSCCTAREFAQTKGLKEPGCSILLPQCSRFSVCLSATTWKANRCSAHL